MSKKRQISSPEEKFKIVFSSVQGDFGSIAELCNHYGIIQTDYYSWRDILVFPDGYSGMPPKKGISGKASWAMPEKVP